MFGASAPTNISTYKIPRAMLLKGNEYLSRRFKASTSRQVWTFSIWVKQAQLTGSSNMFTGRPNSNSDGFLQIDGNRHVRYGEIYQRKTVMSQVTSTGVYRDPSDWMHILFAFNTPAASSSKRLVMYVDGKEISRAGRSNIPKNRVPYFLDVAQLHFIGFRAPDNAYTKDYFAEVILIDGQALGPDSFGTWNSKAPNVWQPRDPSHLDFSGNNSFWLDFADKTNLGKDVSGNGNNWTITRLTAANSVTDTPTNNCATLNPVDKGTLLTLSEGNKKFKVNDRSAWRSVMSTMYVSSGKWYWELKVDATSTHWDWVYYGVGDNNANHGDIAGLDRSSWGFRWKANGSQLEFVHNKVHTVFGGSVPAPRAGTVVQIALDMDTGKVWFGYNGKWAQGDPEAGTGQVTIIDRSPVSPMNTVYNLAYLISFIANEDEFTYTPPAGFNALMAKYLPNPPICYAKRYFDPVVYTGNGGNQTIATKNKVDHLPIKILSGVGSWNVADSVRGSTKVVFWDQPLKEATRVNNVPSFGAGSGFDLGPGQPVNKNGARFLAYPFTKDPIAGMDIVQYIGNNAANRAIPHNLGVVPELMLLLRASSPSPTAGWAVYHKKLGSGYRLRFDTGAAPVTTIFWGNRRPTSTHFTVNGTGDHANNAGSRYIIYLFASVPGFSRVFHYDGVGGTEGAFLYCDFKPAFFLVKHSNGTQQWRIFDSVRDTYNPAKHEIYPSLPDKENPGIPSVDFLSNGVKMRSAGSGVNSKGGLYVGIAFAEYPFGIRGR